MAFFLISGTSRNRAMCLFKAGIALHILCDACVEQQDGKATAVVRVVQTLLIYLPYREPHHLPFDPARSGAE
ncbi:hypothetical protein NDU88_010281 [Pleurodeles waltl]|uniref:Uncharacterized protein n=1 Tax=Pleurodeles waltl TaxID=8319 RepID=A0AAV7QVX8_PLEWA|nr:hypothetical protein NDU88_010281 [Pleurodeles waltl]